LDEQSDCRAVEDEIHLDAGPCGLQRPVFQLGSSRQQVRVIESLK
jgi:hypothetical protein